MILERHKKKLKTSSENNRMKKTDDIVFDCEVKAGKQGQLKFYGNVLGR